MGGHITAFVPALGCPASEVVFVESDACDGLYIRPRTVNLICLTDCNAADILMQRISETMCKLLTAEQSYLTGIATSSRLTDAHGPIQTAVGSAAVWFLSTPIQKEMVSMMYLEIVLQDFKTASHIWHGHSHPPVEATRSSQSWIQGLLCIITITIRAHHHHHHYHAQGVQRGRQFDGQPHKQLTYSMDKLCIHRTDLAHEVMLRQTPVGHTIIQSDT